jgi:hypothetical protein
MAESRVIAFAGNGETTLENATAVLNNWLPEDVEVTGFYIPAAISKRTQKGLANVVSYLTENFADDSGDDPFETVPAGELVNELRKQATAGGPELYLIVILGEAEPDDTTAELIDAAREVNITVLDLAAGLDEYTADEPDAGKDEVVPERPQEARTRRRRTASTPEPAEAAAEPEKPRRQIGTPRTKREVEDIGTKALDSLATARAEAQAAVKEITDPPFDGPYKAGVNPDANGRLIHVTPIPASGSPEAIRVIIREELAAMLYGALSGISGGQALLAAGVAAQVEHGLGYIKDAYGKSEEASGPTAAYIKDADGGLRKRGRGKPRAGEKEVWLTSAQAAEQGYKEDK